MKESWDDYRMRLKQQIPPVMVSLANEARLARCWIYHGRTKTWYTPEEFLQQAKILYTEFRNKSNMKEFTVISPISGLRARIETMKRVSDEVVSFQKRIEDYYSIDLNPRNNVKP